MQGQSKLGSRANCHQKLLKALKIESQGAQSTYKFWQITILLYEMLEKHIMGPDKYWGALKFFMLWAQLAP